MNLGSLIKLANILDEAGAHALADVVDQAVIELAKVASERHLSTRYCPDHVGVSVTRVEENVYQCSLDGKVYDYQNGYVDYDGNPVSGGSIAAQTPIDGACAIPHRVFDTRDNILANSR